MIDGTVNGVGAQAPRHRRRAPQLMQSGNIRSYAAWVVSAR